MLFLIIFLSSFIVIGVNINNIDEEDDDSSHESNWITWFIKLPN